MAWWILLATGILAAILVYFTLLRPLLALREALARLAGGDFRPVLLKMRSGLFSGAAKDLRSVAEMLQQLDRQITDEGFSLRAILSSMVEGVLIVDRSQRIRLANDALGRMFRFGQSPINRQAIEVFRSHELQQAIEETLARGKARPIELVLEVPVKDGYEKATFEVYAGGLNPKPGGQALAAVVVFHDITAIKELESVRREFVANVSHEFRTPLSIINGYIETLLDGALDDREMAERSLRVMHKNGQRLSLLIEDLMTISRIEHRTQQIDFRTMNLRDAFLRARERLEATISQRGAEVVAQWTPDSEIIEGDSRRIEQIYTNLLENALRYGPQENPRVEVEARKVDEFVEIDFRDNGPGIPIEDQRHIFERFYRVHKDRSRVAGGTGLGLSIVKHIAQAHGGSISLESLPGQGCCFRVRLPIQQETQAVASKKAA